MLIELGVGLGLLGVKWVYHRLTEEPPPKQVYEATFPTTEDGAPVGVLFGRYRVSRPAIAWVGELDSEAGSIGNGSPNHPSVYRASVLYEVARGFTSATNNIHGGWIGRKKLFWQPPIVEVPALSTEGHVGGLIEILAGGSTQVLVDPSTGAGVTAAGQRMRAAGHAAAAIPGYRGRISAFLYNNVGGFYFGPSGSFPSVEFEASSYHAGHSQLGTFARVGSDSNPVNVIYEILTSPFLMGLPESAIDVSGTFKAAQYTLHTETHGYSRFWSERVEAQEMLNDVLRQIDGLLYFDHRSKKVKVKLIRPDFSPGDLFVINRSNCQRLVAFAMGGQAQVSNVIVKYRDRAEGYEVRSVRAADEGNIAGHDEQAVIEELDYPGCCDAETAQRIAARELAARSKPFVRCRAIMKRTALRVEPGDPVRVVYTNPDVNAIFRVVDVDRGSPKDGAIALDLVLDTSYVWRGQNPQLPDYGGLPLPPTLPIDVGL